MAMGWALWLRAWFGRIELVALAEPWVQDFRLTWLPEGWRREVTAEGEWEGRRFRLRWRTGFLGTRLSMYLENRWMEVPMESGPDGIKAALTRG